MGQMYGGRVELEDALAITAIQDLGLLFADQGRLGEAETMYQQALQGYEKKHLGQVIRRLLILSITLAASIKLREGYRSRGDASTGTERL